MKPGPEVLADGSVRFVLWAPRVAAVDLCLDDGVAPMRPTEHGYWEVTTARARAGSRYRFRTSSGAYPDPVSRFQPLGVHGPSEVVDFSRMSWTDAGYRPPDPSRLVIYELHTGTFTPDGTFGSAAERLASLAGLGVTAVEVMPVAEFPGARNWGYDGVALHAVHSSYGGPYAFARFVDAAHAVGLAVILDVVFNHFGPEGNYTGQFGHYTTDRYRTPWGEAVNVDGRGSDEVRRYLLDCLEHWMRDYHVDGFRLDAIHEIHDESAVPFLLEASEFVHRYSRSSGRRRVLIAESDLNDRRMVAPGSHGGFGMDAAWSDDFHHSLHALLTGETDGYYADFGGMEHLSRAIERGWSYAWDYSQARGRRHGSDPSGLPSRSFVLCTQNHDQVGNRMLGERLRALAGPGADRLARSLLLLLPYVPLLFMGQEHGEVRPFLYFVDHGDPDLLQATREGRVREFAAFHRDGSPPDPGAADTMARSTIAWPDPGDAAAGEELRLTRELITLRLRFDCFRPAEEGQPEVRRRAGWSGSMLTVDLRAAEWRALIIANLGADARAVSADLAGAGRDARGAGGYEVVWWLSQPQQTGRALPIDGELQLEPHDLVAAVRPRGEGL